VDLTPELVIADRFRLVRPLGHGGMGSVWLAHHIRLEIPCAVKFMLPEVAAEPAFRARFDREAVAAAQLRSPHVVQILDHGTWEGSPYIAMEYLEGEDLEHRLRRQQRLSPAETSAIVAQIARALTKAHAAGLVHRDLKPPNVFLVRDDDREIVKVLDFGVAKSSGPTAGGHTKTGAIMGTPYYMSPEQAQGTRAVDHRTDLWALGVLVYECLTGTLPFVSDAFGDLVLKIIVEPLPVPSQVAPVPPGFDAWWARAVDRDPAGRFQSARELSDALAVALGLGAAEGIGAPATGMSGAPIAGDSLAAGRVPTPVGPAGTPALGTIAAVAASVGASPRPRSRARAVVLGGLASLALLGVGALAALQGRAGPSPAAVVSSPPAMVSAPAAIPAPVPELAAPTASASASVAPSASAASSASVAPSASASPPRPADSASTRAAPRPAGKGAAPGHDLGF
jgi:serine/threonine-protein kinase